MLVIVNPTAAAGRAQARWTSIRPEVERRIGPFEECAASDLVTVRTCVLRALEQGERRFVAAGGDGTVNLVVALLLELATPDTRPELIVGAIGLGSSNDFHKPIQPDALVGRFPCRLDFERSVQHDVGCTQYVDEHEVARVKRWVINASVGTTARGNWLYNEAHGVVGIAKRCSATLGMIVAAIGALLRPAREVMTVTAEDGSIELIRVCNLGVVKNPHFTGCLYYDSPYHPDSGDFFVHLLVHSSPWRTLVTLARLARGKFVGRPGTRSWRSRWLALEAPRPFPVEGDGEIVLARRVVFLLEPRALQVCLP
jgi:diacylglycerol kinase family enzyme